MLPIARGHKKKIHVGRVIPAARILFITTNVFLCMNSLPHVAPLFFLASRSFNLVASPHVVRSLTPRGRRGREDWDCKNEPSKHEETSASPRLTRTYGPHILCELSTGACGTPSRPGLVALAFKRSTVFRHPRFSPQRDPEARILSTGEHCPAGLRRYR